jgi:hypothetical protein
MASAVNKVTGQYISRGIGYLDPVYVNNNDWIVNPTQAEIDQYKYVPPPPDPDVIEKARLIEEKKTELAIEALKADGVLDANGNLK